MIRQLVKFLMMGKKNRAQIRCAVRLRLGHVRSLHILFYNLRPILLLSSIAFVT
jgi:hypothetical protein